jgi:BMFP domain-containing protein YqiC
MNTNPMLIANRKKQEELEARIELLEAKQAGLTDDEIRLLMAKKRAIKRLQGRRELRIHAPKDGD